jgi:hypothetical protein
VIDRIEKNAPVRIAVEQKFSAFGISGTPDLVYYYDDFRLVIDRKFGYNVVERADLNLQLRVYAVITAGEGDCYVAIVQPRAQPDERITIAKYTPEDIGDSRKQIQAILEASEKPDAPLVAGEEQCRYCKAKIICPEFKSKMIVSVAAPDRALSKAAREAYLEQRLSEISDEQLEKVIEAERLAEMIHDPLYEEARKRIKSGKLAAFKLTKQTQVRTVANVRRALALLNLSGLAKDQVFDCITGLSLGKLGDTLRKLNPAWDWKTTNEWVNQKLKTVIEIEVRKERVVRNNEK